MYSDLRFIHFWYRYTGACNTKAPISALRASSAASRGRRRRPGRAPWGVSSALPLRPLLGATGYAALTPCACRLWRFAACPSFALCVVDVACSSSCTRVFDWTVDRQDGQPPRPPGGPRGWLRSLSPRLSRPNNQSASFCPKVASRRPTDCVRGARYAPARPAAAWASERMGAVVARRGVIGQDIAEAIDVYATSVTSWTYGKNENGTNCRE